MEFEQIGGPRKYYKYKECKKGDVLVEEGEYLGTTPNKYGKVNYEFKPADGSDIISLNYSGQLDWVIENNVRIGDTVRVVYNGKILLEKGMYKGKESNQFEIFKGATPLETVTPIVLNKDEVEEIDLEALA